jgi:hypothetical protein
MIRKIIFESVPGIVDTAVGFIPGINIVIGGSGSGKTSLLRSIHPECSELICMDGLYDSGEIIIDHDGGRYVRDGVFGSGDKPGNIFCLNKNTPPPGEHENERCQDICQHVGEPPLTRKQIRIAKIMMFFADAEAGQTILVDDLCDGMDSNQMQIMATMMFDAAGRGCQAIVSTRNGLILDAINEFRDEERHRVNVIFSVKGIRPAGEGVHFISHGNLEGLSAWAEEYAWSEIYEKGVFAT